MASLRLGQGQRSPWNGARVQCLAILTKTSPGACLLVLSLQPLRIGLQRTPWKRPQLQNSHCRTMVRGAQEVARKVGPSGAPRPSCFLF